MKKAFRILSSYELSCVLFLLLFVLTLLGTLYQVEHGLYQAQQKYFASFFLIHWLLGVLPIPLPGGYLVMGLTFVNLLLGGVVRVRKDWRRLGILLGHVGILMLLAGAFISYQYAQSGSVTLYEGESAGEFSSERDWEIGVREAGGSEPVTEYIIRGGNFQMLRGGRTGTFYFANIPFELMLTGYDPAARATQEVVLPSIRAAVLPKDTGAAQERILWAGSEPAAVDVAGKSYAIELRRGRWPLPFTIQLDKFTRELHPGTNQPKLFRSDVTKIESGIEQPARISMNEPLRHNGYTFYQSSWGQAGAGSSERLYSTLAVVRNPADKLPLWACLVITLGLTLHLGQKLLRYLLAQRVKVET
ncbi:MAG: cytochrome c biogenesis protein ResB [Candidatus Hydrogenedentes bacterium]|nr:cytochrome c biogenesis protein ResB [Candidatus Hydrogenedentota bacterium]